MLSVTHVAWLHAIYVFATTPFFSSYPTYNQMQLWDIFHYTPISPSCWIFKITVGNKYKMFYWLPLSITFIWSMVLEYWHLISFWLPSNIFVVPLNCMLPKEIITQSDKDMANIIIGSIQRNMRNNRLN